ncbi:MAG: arylsulfatase [Verrucomicrobiota bacterium JB025]|nr:arylsulfatase [Verrucomicrobiota bacterium JB025]
MTILIVLALTAICSLSEEKPNILYILADDLGFGDLGCYGQEVIQTPHIDKLCREGMKFTNHHSGSTVCAPSRACLMTGQHTGHVWVRSNGNIQLRADGEDLTIARVLKDIGYHTAMIGKAGTGCTVSVGQPNEKGFDYFYGFNSHALAHHYFPKEVYRNDQKVRFPNNRRHTGDTYIHDEFMKEIMGYLDQRKKDGRPFFLHYAALIPHATIVAPDEWIERYRGKVDEVSPFKGGGGGGRNAQYGPVEEPKATFAGMVSRLDWEIGEIRKKLEELGLADNTLIMFSSDNGPHGEGGHSPDHFGSNGPLRGGKRDMFEGGVRVPLIAWWPGKIAAGSESEHLSAFWDVMPTLCELTGASSPESIDGISFLPTLLGQGGQAQHDYLYWEFYEQGGKRAALTQKWKAVQLNVGGGGDPMMLFDIHADIGEKNDVAAQYPEVVDQFRGIFKKAHTPSPKVKWPAAAKGKIRRSK